MPAAIRAGVDLELDRGELPGTPSTVVDLCALEADGSWRIVRDGGVPPAAVGRALVGSEAMSDDASGRLLHAPARRRRSGDRGRDRAPSSSASSDTLELIASENFVPHAVLEAQGSVLTNKYAEGYPGARYYGGCEYVDIVEQLAIDRAKALFGAEHANVQPHSGAQANAAVYHALLEPGDTIMGLVARPRRPPHPRHEEERLGPPLRHRPLRGRPRDEPDRHGCGRRASPASTGPKLLLAGWSAYPRQLDFARFREIADEVGALLMVDMAHFAGLVAAGCTPTRSRSVPTS